MKLVDLPKQRRVPADTADALRALADQVESGECTDVVWCAVLDGNYDMRSGSSINDSLILSTLLQDWCLRRFRE